jgi:hypothetical protein
MTDSENDDANSHHGHGPDFTSGPEFAEDYRFVKEVHVEGCVVILTFMPKRPIAHGWIQNSLVSVDMVVIGTVQRIKRNPSASIEISTHNRPVGREPSSTQGYNLAWLLRVSGWARW